LSLECPAAGKGTLLGRLKTADLLTATSTISQSATACANSATTALSTSAIQDLGQQNLIVGAGLDID